MSDVTEYESNTAEFDLSDQVTAESVTTLSSSETNGGVHNASSADPGALAAGEDRSPYLINQLLFSKDENLFNHVKFHVVKQHIDSLGLSELRILDIGCGLQVSRMYLTRLGLRFDYFGVDYENRFRPDAVVDLIEPESITASLPWSPNVVLMLDVLEHLHEDSEILKDIVARLATAMPDDCVFIFTLPQMYRLDRFKLSHLVYPEHKVRFEQHEWRRILSHALQIERTQGLGYLSVIPYLPMASKRYAPDNRLGRLFSYLRGTVFEWGPLKPVDVFLSNTLGKIGFFKTWSNDVVFVARTRFLARKVSNALASSSTRPRGQAAKEKVPENA